MSTALRALAAAFLVLVMWQSAAAANRYDPRLHFRTIATPRFTIYFHQHEEALARRLAGIAEDVADRVAGQIGRANGRVHVILVDQNDLSNGWANPFPYNVIEINAAAPPGASMIGNTDDWLRLVLSHEYTHIVHLDKARGWLGGLRNVFGHSPLLYPNVFLPLWQIEGIATYNETVLTGQGRIPTGDFRAIVDRAASSRRFDPLDRANGGLVDWPGGATHYAYGAYFHQYLADRFGPESIAKLADETSGRVPYFGAPAFRKVFKRSLGELWDDFAADTRAHAREETTGRTRLTHHGFNVGTPTFSQSGRLFYSVANPHGFPALMELPRDGSKPRVVTTRFLGVRIAAAGTQIVFDQIEVVHNVGLQSDLYAVDESGGRARRLTHLARAADPDVAPDGRTVVCTVQSADRRALATFQMPQRGTFASPTPLLSEAGTEYSSPRWSPDGQSIAAERRQLRGPSEIVLVDVATARERPIVSSRDARNVTPLWLSSTTVLFASDRGGEPFGIYAVDVATGAIRRLNGEGLSAQSPAVSPDGRELVFVGYTADGYDLFSMPLASAVWSDVPAASGTNEAVQHPPDAAPVTTADRPYRPWRTLWPQFWTPVIESDAGETTVGAATAASDALGRHGYNATITWATARARPDWSVGYAYDRWSPTLFASVSDDTDPWQGGEIRTREVNAGALFTIARIRWFQTVLAAFNASTDTFDCGPCASPAQRDEQRRAIRTGWRFRNAKTYGYSISDESGTALRMTWETAPEALGSDTHNSAVTVDARGYLWGGPRHAVIAVRGAAASAWGTSGRRIFSASGPGPATSDFEFGRDAIGLLRGFASDAVVGNHAAVGNIDYRIPIRSLQHGAGTLPIFFRSLHAALFADAGHAWADRFQSADVRVSAGAELSLDTDVGYALPVTFTAGVAWRRDPRGDQGGVTVFGRIGRAF